MISVPSRDTETKPLEATTALFMLAVPVIALTVIRPAFAFLLLLSIPLFKLYLRFLAPGLMESYNFDMAAVSLALFAAIMHRARSGVGTRITIPAGFVGCWLAICLLMWIRLPASPAYDVGLKKALIFTVFNTLVCLSTAIYITSVDDILRLLRVLILISILAVAGMLAFGEGLQSYRGARQSFLGASVLGVSDACAYGGIIIYCRWIAQRKFWQLLLSIVMIPLYIYVAVATGTRAAVLVPPIPLLAATLLYRRTISVPTVIVTAAGISIVIFVVGTILSPDMLTRFDMSKIERGIENRVFRMEVAWQGIVRSPIIGNGPGNTARELTLVQGGYDYPHNHLLEIFNELGLAGAAAYMVLIGYGLRIGFRLSRREFDRTREKAICVPVFACLLYCVLLSFKTGTYAASYYIYFFLVVSVAASGLTAETGRQSVHISPHQTELSSGGLVP